MKVMTAKYGEVEAWYYRTAAGGEGLCTKRGDMNALLAAWNEDMSSPPPILLPRDLSTTADWDRLLSYALAEQPVGAVKPQAKGRAKAGVK